MQQHDTASATWNLQDNFWHDMQHVVDALPRLLQQNKPIFFVDALPWQLHFIHQHLMKQTSENAHHDP